MRNLAQRLRAAREAADLTLDAVGKAVGVTAQAVYRWEKGSSLPSSDRIARLARVLNVTPDYLLTGTDSVRDTTAQSGAGGQRTVPVYLHDDIASGTLSPKRQASTHFPCGPDAYAVSLWDNSNAPRFAIGDQVVIDPGIVPDPGDMVLAVIAGQSVFARYETAAVNGTRHVLLRPLDEKWAPHALVESQSRAAIRGVMTEHAAPRRR